jgi:subtilisin family serine protease
VRAFRVPDDEFWPTQWSLRKTRAERAWDVTTGSPQVVVAVVNTGVDPAQPDLRGKVGPGLDFVSNDADPRDDNGHGTDIARGMRASTERSSWRPQGTTAPRSPPTRPRFRASSA